MTRLDRITTDPAVCHGQPTIRGLRYTVESVLELLAAGMTVDEVLADYPDLEPDDIARNVTVIGAGTSPICLSRVLNVCIAAVGGTWH